MSDEHRSISEIDVKFPVAKTWTELETRYLTLRSKLINLYGTPVYSEERFNGNVSDFDLATEIGNKNMRHSFVKTYIINQMVGVSINVFKRH